MRLVSFGFKKQDKWIGPYGPELRPGERHYWLCILPCLPLHFVLEEKR